MHSLMRDLRFALRQFRKNPGFTTVTVVTLALGIGATTSIFSLVNTVLLRPLPFPHSDRLMSVQTGQRLGSGPATGMYASYPDFFDWRAQNHSFSAMSSFHDENFTLSGRGEAKHLNGEVVSAEFFHVLGANPMLGRTFTYEEEKPQSNVVVLGHELWQSSFGGDTSIVGRSITLDERPYTVIGVMPASFRYPLQDPAPALWTSLGDDAYDPGGEPTTGQRGAHYLDVIGRLKDRVAPEAAIADLNVIAGNLSKQYPASNKKFSEVVIRPLLESLVGSSRAPLRMLFGAVGFVLLIACVNVAGLLLARGSQRRGEIALRGAMGATRWEIVRQMLVESVALSLLGGALGVMFAMASLRALVHFVPQDLPRLNQVAMDGEVLLFGLAVSTLTGLAFGVLPAWRVSRLDPAQSLRQGSRTTGDRAHHRIQSGLVIAETALGLVLLAGSGLLVHSFVRVLQVDPGFDSRNLLTARIDLPDRRYPKAKPVDFYKELLPKLSALPGVTAVSAGWPLPLTMQFMSISFWIEGHPIPPGERPGESVAIALPGYFSTMHIPLIAGRDFTANDDSGHPSVAIITDTFAKKYFPHQNPLGQHMDPGLSDGVTKRGMREIVGIVADVKARSLTADKTPQYYLPYAQALVSTPTLCIRSAGDPSSLIAPLRAIVAEMDPNVALYSAQSFQTYVNQSASQPKFQAMLLSCFAIMGLVLFAVGLYAVLSYTVVQRTQEIGVRMALGAQRGDVLKMFLSQGLRLTVIGSGVGIVAAFALARLIANLLYGVKASDPGVFVLTPLVIAAVAFVASLAPAQRATRVEPMQALKYE